MKRLALLTLLSALGQTAAASAAPATATGPAALALASVVGQHSPSLSADDKKMIGRLFDGDSDFPMPVGKILYVTADSIVCRVSDVDITARRCELTFNTGKSVLNGRDANEVNATLVAAGVMQEGAAGSMIESITKLVCSIDSNEIRQKTGGGAKCDFETGQ